MTEISLPTPTIECVFPVWIPDEDMNIEVQALVADQTDYVAVSYHGTDGKKHHLVLDRPFAEKLGASIIAAARHTADAD